MAIAERDEHLLADGLERVRLANPSDMLDRPAWMADASCRDHPEVNFFPERGEDSAPAKAICAGCLVRDECRAYAMAGGDEHGIWGGLSAVQRLRLRRSGAPMDARPPTAKEDKEARSRRRADYAKQREQAIERMAARGRAVLQPHRRVTG